MSSSQSAKATPYTATTPGINYFNPGSDAYYIKVVTQAHTDIILRLVQEGKMQAAINDVVYTLDRIPNHSKGLELAIIVSKLAKTSGLALCYFERAVRFYPQYALTHAQYGAYLVSTSQFDDGITRLKQEIELDPKLAGAYVLLAKAYNQNGNAELAKAAAD